MGKPTICIGKNKGADQLSNYCEADPHLCFRYTDSTVYIRAYAEQTVTERTDVYRSTRFFAPKMFFRSFKVTNANIETKLEQMCCIHTRLVVCAQEHNDFSGGSP